MPKVVFSKTPSRRLERTSWSVADATDALSRLMRQPGRARATGPDAPPPQALCRRVPLLVLPTRRCTDGLCRYAEQASAGPRRFDQAVWNAQPWSRWAMASNLASSERLVGLDRSELEGLLGAPDGSYNGPPGTDPEQLEAWMLYRPRDMLIPFPPELAVLFEDGRVGRAWVEPALF